MTGNCAVCGRTSKHFDDMYNLGYCGYHKGFLGIPAYDNAPYLANNQMVLPKCCGLTKLGLPCKRNGKIIDGDNVYCYQHKVPAPNEESSIIPGYIRDDCPICYNSLMDGTTLAKTHCGHFFHKGCIMRWKESSLQGNTCPICRRDTHISRNANRVTRIYTSIEEF